MPQHELEFIENQRYIAGISEVEAWQLTEQGIIDSRTTFEEADLPITLRVNCNSV